MAEDVVISRVKTSVEHARDITKPKAFAAVCIARRVQKRAISKLHELGEDPNAPDDIRDLCRLYPLDVGEKGVAFKDENQQSKQKEIFLTGPPVDEGIMGEKEVASEDKSQQNEQKELGLTEPKEDEWIMGLDGSIVFKLIDEAAIVAVSVDTCLVGLNAICENTSEDSGDGSINTIAEKSQVHFQAKGGGWIWVCEDEQVRLVNQEDNTLVVFLADNTTVMLAQNQWSVVSSDGPFSEITRLSTGKLATRGRNEIRPLDEDQSCETIEEEDVLLLAAQAILFKLKAARQKTMATVDACRGAMSRCHDRVLFVKTEIKRGEEVLGEVGRSFLDEDCDPGKVPTVVLTSNGTYAKLSMTEGGALHVTLLQFPDGSQLSFRTSQTQIWISPHGHENAIINVDGSATYIEKRSSFAAGEPSVVRVDFNADGSRVASLQDGSRVHIEAEKKKDGPDEEDNGVEEGGLGASITSNGGLEANILSIDGAFTRVERKKNNGTSAQSILQPDGTLLYRNTETREDWALQEGDRLVVMREGLILPPRVSCDAAAADGRKTTSILKPRRMLLDIDNGFETNLNEEVIETESGIKEETCQGVIPAPRVTRTTF